MTRASTILLVDPEPAALEAMRAALEGEFDCVIADSTEAALRQMREHDVEVVICDDGSETGAEGGCFDAIAETWPETQRILLTGPDAGARAGLADPEALFQLVPRPWHPDQLRVAARNAARFFRVSRERDRMSLEIRCRERAGETKLERTRKAADGAIGFESLLRATDSALNPVVEQARQYASFDVPVMLIGEPGTGRAHLARAMHNASLRSEQPYFVIDCAGMSDEMLGIELAGARPGALSGPPRNRIGLLQKAERGTIFVNGVETLSGQMQAMLLRVVTQGRFLPLGSHEEALTQARILSGADPAISQAVEAGTFRRDLYYALAATELSLPPLRARPGDLSILAHRILVDLAAEHGKPSNGLSDLAVEFLSNYDWPGNLPELENELLRMLIAAQDPVCGPELISRHILQADPSLDADAPAQTEILSGEGTLKDRVELVEMRILRETLTRLKWNKSRAASELGLSRVGLRAKLDRYGVTQPGKVATELGKG